MATLGGGATPRCGSGCLRHWPRPPPHGAPPPTHERARVAIFPLGAGQMGFRGATPTPLARAGREGRQIEEEGQGYPKRGVAPGHAHCGGRGGLETG